MNLLPINTDQTEDNPLTAIANAERPRLFTKNDYSMQNMYSSTHPDALSTGDPQGKGTGGDLDIFNEDAGGSIDIAERRFEIRVNKYNMNRTYPDF
jgi:hypothetical protein